MSLLDDLPASDRDRLKATKQPAWMPPMLATLTDEYFSDEAWIFERKLDGERCLAFRAKGSVRLLSRNRKELHATYPEIADALQGKVGKDLIIDGEVVAFEGAITSFSRLQQRMKLRDPEAARASGIPIYYYAFDLLYLDGYDTRQLPLRRRKALLKRALTFDDPLRFTSHRNAEGEAYYREACRKGWEGVIAKRADSQYVADRSRSWLKFKCVNEQELVVGGYTDPKGSRIGFGALLVGYYEGGDLVYAGQVGTGFDDDTLHHLGERMSSIEQAQPAFGGDALPAKGVHWVRPKLVAQVGFTEWTNDGRLRHPRFLGLRRDKDPREVRRERP